MKSIFNSFMLAVITLTSMSSCDAQINNVQSADVKVYGNCGMCKKRIEKAAAVSGEAKAVWDVDTGIATITIDSTKTTIDDVLKRIAAAGHDSDQFRSDDEVYSNLHGCCQYDRPEKKMDSPDDEE
ncbi:MAG: heavy-metal-associated domain-containing protein [Saprospiraceae bacterium]|nr:heavy-metal-associated domain-containing protein [Saprospiraceae bacterium]